MKLSWRAIFISALLAVATIHAMPQMVHAGPASALESLACTACGRAAGSADCATECLKAVDVTRNAVLPRTAQMPTPIMLLFFGVCLIVYRFLHRRIEADPDLIGPRLIAGLVMRE